MNAGPLSSGQDSVETVGTVFERKDSGCTAFYCPPSLVSWFRKKEMPVPLKMRFAYRRRNFSSNERAAIMTLQLLNVTVGTHTRPIVALKTRVLVLLPHRQAFGTDISRLREILRYESHITLGIQEMSSI